MQDTGKPYSFIAASAPGRSPIILCSFALLFLLQLALPAGLQAADFQAADRPDTIWHVEFDGNRTFSNMVLRDITATSAPSLLQKIFRRTDDYAFNENEVRRDVIRIERFYHRRGFESAEVSWVVEPQRKEWKKVVRFTVKEGPATQIAETIVEFDAPEEIENAIRGTRNFERALGRHDFQAGTRYQPIHRADVEGRFVQAIQESGYAWAVVEVEEERNSETGQVTIRILCTPGPLTTFSNFILDGELSVSDRIALRETTLREGELFDPSRMQTAQRELFNHHLFRFATVSLPEQEQDSTLDVSIRIREHPLRSIEATGGVGREEILRAQVTWLHRNVLQRGHRFSATGRASFIDQRAGMEYMIPYAFNTHSSYVSSPYVQHRVEPSFELLRVGFSNSLIYQYSRDLTGSVSYEITFNEELSSRPEATLPDSVLSYNTASLIFSGYYSQGLGRSEQGWVVHPLLEFSSLFDEGTYGFQKASLDVRKYTRITDGLMLAKRVQGGVIFSAEQDSLPGTVRFFSGGTNTVRGWSRQMLGPKRVQLDGGEFVEYVPIGGRALFNFNVELRQRLDRIIPGLGIAVFLDGGQVWRHVEESGNRPVQFGSGAGIRYDSPIGPVRIDFAYKLNPTDEDLGIYNGVRHGSEMNRIGIHFSIGQAF
ncbi:MAG: BamA/TamA family outer membrane protein [Balneolaceae bacterium]